jgi:hypothetical protein
MMERGSICWLAIFLGIFLLKQKNKGNILGRISVPSIAAREAVRHLMGIRPTPFAQSALLTIACCCWWWNTL